MEMESSLTRSLVVALVLLVLTVVESDPQEAVAYSRGPFPFALHTTTPEGQPPVGMCASAVRIHGYKCQEFDVRPLN